MPPSYTLYTPEASFRAFAILVAAEINGVEVKIETSLDNASKSPVGKLPLLETSDGRRIFSSHSAARFMAGLRTDTKLLGSATIDSWMDWASSDLELPCTVWFYPVAGYMPFYKAAYEKAKADLANALQVLENYLKVDKKRFLVDNTLSLADITVAATLLYPFKLVCDSSFRKPFPNVVRWFESCVALPEFQQVVGKVVLCTKELKASGHE